MHTFFNHHMYDPRHVSDYDIRPHIGCTFASMRACDRTFGEGSEASEQCREGARDAHLLDFSFGRGEAYHAGRSFTLSCPPSLDVGFPYTHPYRDCHDPRRWPSC